MKAAWYEKQSVAAPQATTNPTKAVRFFLRPRPHDPGLYAKDAEIPDATADTSQAELLIFRDSIVRCPLLGTSTERATIRFASSSCIA